jgi:hypothetical protein
MLARMRVVIPEPTDDPDISNQHSPIADLEDRFALKNSHFRIEECARIIQIGDRRVLIADVGGRERHAVLLIPQGFQWIHLRRPSGWSITSEDGHGQEEQRHSGERDRIESIHFE